MQTNRKLFSKVHSLVITELHRYYQDKAAGLGIKSPTPGSIAFTQRWGSALNLNPHLHVLCPDGVYTRVRGLPRFRNIDPITDQEVATLVECIALRVTGYLQNNIAYEPPLRAPPRWTQESFDFESPSVAADEMPLHLV